MATPNTFTADMLKNMEKMIEDYRPRQSLLVSAGFRQKLVKQADLLKPSLGASPIFYDYAQSYMGIQIEAADIPPEEVIDWSGCRSPSRAKRRHAIGIPQRIKVTYRDRAYLINKDVLAKFGRDMDARMLAAIYTTR